MGMSRYLGPPFTVRLTGIHMLHRVGEIRCRHRGARNLLVYGLALSLLSCAESFGHLADTGVDCGTFCAIFFVPKDTQRSWTMLLGHGNESPSAWRWCKHRSVNLIVFGKVEGAQYCEGLCVCVCVCV